ncbi:hypothetical protein BHE74_00043188 [Ensete ventricosum]|nr:hypothetical protein BHE74_00043188 [Ensete ventricosum]
MGKLVYEIKCEGEEDEEERGGPTAWFRLGVWDQQGSMALLIRSVVFVEANTTGRGRGTGRAGDSSCCRARTVGVARGAPSLVVTPVPHRSCHLPPRVLFRPSRLKVRLAPPLPSPPLDHVRGRAPPHVTASRNLTASIWLV